MKDFKFSLERMRSYKDQLLDREKDVLARCRGREREAEDRIRALEAALLEKREELSRKEKAGMPAGELGVYRLYQENGRRRMEELRAELLRARAESERQLQKVVAASQEVSSLDKLEERQREEYQLQAAKEGEKTISEFVSSRLIRERADGAGA